MRRRRFTAEFKGETAEPVARTGASRAQVAQVLGLNAAMLSKWVREAGSGNQESGR